VVLGQAWGGWKRGVLPVLSVRNQGTLDLMGLSPSGQRQEPWTSIWKPMHLHAGLSHEGHLYEATKHCPHHHCNSLLPRRQFLLCFHVSMGTDRVS